MEDVCGGGGACSAQHRSDVMLLIIYSPGRQLTGMLADVLTPSDVMSCQPTQLKEDYVFSPGVRTPAQSFWGCTRELAGRLEDVLRDSAAICRSDFMQPVVNR